MGITNFLKNNFKINYYFLFNTIITIINTAGVKAKNLLKIIHNESKYSLKRTHI